MGHAARPNLRQGAFGCAKTVIQQTPSARPPPVQPRSDGTRRHVGAGLRRRPSIIRRIFLNRPRGTATSANWNVTYRTARGGRPWHQPSLVSPAAWSATSAPFPSEPPASSCDAVDGSHRRHHDVPNCCCCYGSARVCLWLQADRGGDRRNPTKPTRTTRPDYPA